jgi:IEC3 subunit of the Ino80 complex, chromatin re-modelling
MLSISFIRISLKLPYISLFVITSLESSKETNNMGVRKKFRKMKFKFEQKMNQSNVWYKQEQEAAETARRLAVENELVHDLSWSRIQG